jgi:hypothetical protein
VRVRQLNKGIVLAEFDSFGELGRAFVRAQEFFESPRKQFRGKFFTLESFQQWYRDNQSESGKFTYSMDFGGYNIPGEVYCDFVVKFMDNMSDEEYELFDKVNRLTNMCCKVSSKFYLIGCKRGDRVTLNHEVHHAFYKLYPKYHDTVRWILKQSLLDVSFDPIKRYLIDNMYTEEVFSDEIAAYLMFEEKELKKANINLKVYQTITEQLLQLFNLYKRRRLWRNPKGQTRTERHTSQKSRSSLQVGRASPMHAKRQV